ncbi:MAG: hypothetical protein WAL63_01370, partial [Solirubrobacteraceae bacterium]
ERTIKEFGFGLAAAVFLDALVIRCVMLPAILEILGPTTWRLPPWLDLHLPRINIEGGDAHTTSVPSGRPADRAGEPGQGARPEPVQSS